jgi:hypothetical protein
MRRRSWQCTHHLKEQGKLQALRRACQVALLSPTTSTILTTELVSYHVLAMAAVNSNAVLTSRLNSDEWRWRCAIFRVFLARCGWCHRSAMSRSWYSSTTCSVKIEEFQPTIICIIIGLFSGGGGLWWLRLGSGVGELFIIAGKFLRGEACLSGARRNRARPPGL